MTENETTERPQAGDIIAAENGVQRECWGTRGDFVWFSPIGEDRPATGRLEDWTVVVDPSRASRLAEIIEEHGGDAFEVTDETGEPERYALVEVNVGGSTPPYWITTHDTPSDAAAYSINQEHASDWGIVSLTDLQTGDHIQATTATVVEVTFP